MVSQHNSHGKDKNNLNRIDLFTFSTNTITILVQETHKYTQFPRLTALDSGPKYLN